MVVRVKSFPWVLRLWYAARVREYWLGSCVFDCRYGFPMTEEEMECALLSAWKIMAIEFVYLTFFALFQVQFDYECWQVKTPLLILTISEISRNYIHFNTPGNINFSAKITEPTRPFISSVHFLERIIITPAGLPHIPICNKPMLGFFLFYPRSITTLVSAKAEIFALKVSTFGRCKKSSRNYRSK